MFKKIQKLTLYILLAYTLLGFFVIPFVVKSQLVDIVQKETLAKITIDSVYFNPLAFKLELSGIKLVDKSDKNLLSLKSLSINVELLSLFNSAVHLSHLIIQEPKISLIYNKDKTINLASILKPKKKEAKKVEESKINIPRIILDRVAIVNGAIEYEDYTHESNFAFAFKHIGFELKDIDSADFNSSRATIRFYTSLDDGGFFDFKSRIVGFKPLIVKGSMNFEASKLYTEWRYLKDKLNLEVADGKITFNSDFYVNIDDLNSTTIDNLNISLDKLRVKPKDGYKDVLNLENFFVSNAKIKPMQQLVHIDRVGLKSLALMVKRDKKQKIDWLKYIEINSQDELSSDENKSESTMPWHLKIDDIALENISAEFKDAGISPQVNTKLNEMNIYLQNITLAGDEPLFYQIDLKLNEEFLCQMKGDVKHKDLSINSYTKCSDLDIVRFRPYIDREAKKALATYDVKLKRARVGFDANVTISDSKVNVIDANVELSRFALNKRSTGERLIDFKNFALNGVSLDTETKVVNISKTSLNKLNIKSKLQNNGTLNMDNLVVPKESKKSSKKEKQTSESYRVKIKHFALNSAKVDFEDRTLQKSLKTKLDKIDLDAYNIDSSAKTWLDYTFSARLNSKGYLKSKGRVEHTPLKQKGSFTLEKISLKEFSPYLQKSMYLNLVDGYVDLKTDVAYAKEKNSADIVVNGYLNVSELFINDSRDNSALFSLNSLAFNDFEYDISPDRFFVNEVDVDGFYVNAIIDREKNMNFSSLVKDKSDANITKTEDENSSKFPFKIMKLSISSGSANFADLSLPLKFKTDIHDLKGVVYAISSSDGEVSYVDINGEVDKYGSTKLVGSIDSSNPKQYTDLAFNFKNLDLNSLSGYSANFAGYKIDAGKLFLDLNYDIIDSQLKGKNSIIVKKIKLGEEIEDENSSSLPLGFAIALLEDSDGIIDIDMPVEGNVDEPDFKYGALIWKTFGGLIVKAVASPFKFLGSMMGLDGEELEYLEFEAGLANMLPPQREKLDNISKIMIKRPKISLSITPQYDEKVDGWIVKKEKFIEVVMKKAGVKNKEEHLSALSIDLLEDIYEEYFPKKSLDAIKSPLKKEYKGAIYDRKYLDAMLKEIISAQTVSKAELNALATKRGSLIREYLVNSKNIDLKRVIINDTKMIDNSTNDMVQTKMEISVE